SITAGLLRIGAVTLPGGSSPTTEAGSIAITSAFDMTGIATLDLEAAGAITQTAALTNLGTLIGNAGTLTLNDSSNTIDDLGNFTGTHGFALTDASTLTVIGTIAAPGSTLALTSTGDIALGVSAGAQGVLNAATVSLNGLAVTEPNGTVIATTEFDGTADSFALTGTNTIAALGTVTASTGDLAIADTAALNVIGTVTASAGNLWLESAAAGGITIAAGGTVDAVSGRLGLQADALSNQGSLIARNGTLEFAPDTAGGTMSLGGTSFAGLGNVSATTLQFGKITLPGGSSTVTAGGIDVAGSFNAGALTLDLETTGAVTQSASLVNVGTLIGNAGTILLTASGNTIGALGALTAASTLAVLDAAAMSVAGLVKSTGGNVYLQSSDPAGINFLATGTANAFDTVGLRADALSIGSGSVSAPTVELAPNSGAMVLGSGGTSPANLAQITATTLRVGAITLPGSSTPTPIASAISITSPFNASVTTLDLETTGAVTQSASLVVAGTLAANAGTLTLTNSGNQIGTLGTVT